MKKNGASSQMLQFRLSLKDVKPEIWRKLLVSSDTTLAGLHAILQILFGWNGRHLYAFVVNNRRYFPPHEDLGDPGKYNSLRTQLSSVFTRGVKAITYEYDFRDGWEVELSREPRSDGSRASRSIECIEGSRHGPIEDSGGSRDYMEKARIYNNPQHKRHQEIRQFIGPSFDPEAFDLRRINEMLARRS